MPQFAANLSMQFNEVPFLQRFSAAAQAGYRAVEFLFPYEFVAEDIVQELRAHHLRNVLFNLAPGNWAGGERGLAGLPGRQQEFKASVAQALQYAEVLGTPRLHVMAGLQPAGVARETCLEIYVDNLRYACAEAANYGIACLIEPINTRDMPGYLLNLQAEAHALREQVGEPNLLVQMDLYHAQIMEGDLAAKLRKYLPYVGHIQIAGVPDRHEPDSGEVNYPYLFKLIDELGYKGWIGCEYRPAAGTVEGLGWMQTALKAKA